MPLKKDTLDKAQVLLNAEIFAGLPEELVRNVAVFAAVRHLDRGELLYSQDENASSLFVVAEGELSSVRQSADGREQVLSTAHCGASLAAMSVFHGETYFSTVVANGPAVVLGIDRCDVQRLCGHCPELTRNLARLLARQVHESVELIESLAFRHVDQRVAQYLLGVATQRGIRSQENGGLVFELTQTRAELANRLGSVREVVSRSFAHLQEAKLIVLEGKRFVTIPNPDALRKFAGTADDSRQL